MAPALPRPTRRFAATSAAVVTSLAVVTPLLPGGLAAATPLPPSTAGAMPFSEPTTAPVARKPVTPEVAEVAVPGVDRASAPQLAAVSAPQPVEGFGVVGASWAGGTPDGVRFAVRTQDDGHWSTWQELHGGALDDHAPDPGTVEARGARAGTEALAVGEVDAVQLRATSPEGEAPRDLELSVVSSPQTAADARLGEPVLRTGTMAPTAARTMRTAGVTAPRPQIYSRAQWGADERLRSGSPSYGTIRAGFVHHTVNANEYTAEQVPSLIRGIYAYHTQSNGWSDVGYNFLVDRFGRVWEGRYGGVDRPVIGAHTYGYNHESFAMSAIGNFETVQPTAKMVAAYGRLFAWKLGLHGVPADARTQLGGRTLPTINGHRDTGSTACPGRYLYAKLPAIRTAAANIQSTDEPTPPPPPPPLPPPPPPPPAPEVERDGPGVPRDLQADGFPDIVSREASTDQLQVFAGDGGPRFAHRRTVLRSAKATDLLTGVGDVTGDRLPDLLTRDDRSGRTYLRKGVAGGGFGAPTTPTHQFAKVDVLAGVGNMIGNKRPDLLVRDARNDNVYLHTGHRDGAWGRRHLLIRNAGQLRMLTSAGDLDRDGRRDLVARVGKSLRLYPGLGRGRVGQPREIARRWAGNDLFVAGQDVTGDGRPDVVARERASGRTWIYLTGEDGKLVRRYGGWPQWSDLDRLTNTGNVTGSTQPDLLARTHSGKLIVFPGLGTRWLQGSASDGPVAPSADFMQVAGDWNGDGSNDVVTRSGGSGAVWLYPGDGAGGLTAPVRMWGRWGAFTDLVAPGDMTGDGRADIAARTPDGSIYLYPGDGRKGREPRILARENLFATDLITAAGYWDEDGVRDLIVRRSSSKELWLVPGRADGTLGAPSRLSGSFAAYDKIVGVGDFNRDGRSDVLVREQRSGSLWLFAGSASGLQPRQYVAEGMERYDLIG